MLTIHAGLPKTATTGAQHGLATHADLLSGAGIDYVPILRDREGIAHHAIPSELLERGDTDGPNVRALVEYLRAANAPHKLISSEAFTNLIAGPRRTILLKLTGEIAEFMPVRVVLVLRRVDDFLASMYLQSTKVGEVTESFDNYLAKRANWSAGLFAGLRAIRQDAATCELHIMKYRTGSLFLVRTMGQIVKQPDLFIDLEMKRRSSARLTHKGHAVLLNLPDVETRIGETLPRFPLIRALEHRKLTFQDDGKLSSLLQRDKAEAIHRAAMDAAESAGDTYYGGFFGEDVIA
ncbi:MAG: hypothetical protein AAFW98_19515, partial [Pseudomonadota bacterium]